MAAKKPRCVLSHYGFFKNVWDAVILLATIYVAVMVPYNAAFKIDHTDCGLDHLGQPSEVKMKESFIFDIMVEGLFMVGKLVLLFSELNFNVKDKKF